MLVCVDCLVYVLVCFRVPLVWSSLWSHTLCMYIYVLEWNNIAHTNIRICFNSLLTPSLYHSREDCWAWLSTEDLGFNQHWWLALNNALSLSLSLSRLYLTWGKPRLWGSGWTWWVVIWMMLGMCECKPNSWWQGFPLNSFFFLKPWERTRCTNKLNNIQRVQSLAKTGQNTFYQ